MTLLYMTTVPVSLGFLAGRPGYLRRHGFDVHALASPGPDLDAFGAREDVPVHPVPMLRQISPFRDLVALYRLAGVLRVIDPSIVHAGTPKGGLLGMLSAWLSRVPVRVYTIYGFPHMTESGLKRLLLLWSERVSCRLAHQVYSVSHSIRQVAISDRICSPDRISVLGGGSINGVDAWSAFNPDRIAADGLRSLRQFLGIPEGAPVIAFVGRIARDKGIAELLAAWNIVRARHRSAHMMLVGDMDERDPAARAGLRAQDDDDRLHLPGHVGNVAEMLAMADIIVLPTYREGFPNVLLEAAAMAKPVVATLIPGCIDAVADGVTGTLVPPKDATALAGAIDRYLTDPELRARHGQAGRERVLRDFRQEDIWEALHTEYVRLLTERGLPVPTPGAPEPAPASPIGTRP